MSQNKYAHGERIQFIAPAGGVVSGTPYLLGSILGIPVTSAAENEISVLDVEGVFEITKDAPLVIAQGAKVYWNNTDKEITTTAAGNTFAGWAYVAAASADTTVLVKLGLESGVSTAGTATVIAALGTTTDLTAIAATFSDLAAARTAVNTLKTETETRLDTIEAKVDAILAALKAAGLMANA